MRRLIPALLAAVLLVLPPASVDAAKPPPVAITSVTITADGGAWPVCRAVAEIGYQTSHHRASVNIWPVIVNDACGNTASHWSSVRGSGTLTVTVQNDYTPLVGDPIWAMRIELWTRPHMRSYETSTFVMSGTCPTSGVIASWVP